jgi:hypothetical protein
MLSTEQQEQLADAIRGFGEALEQLDAHDPLVAFLLSQRDRMATALVEYRIVGASSLVERVYELEGAVINHIRIADPEQRKGPGVVAASSLIRTVKQVLTGTILAAGALKAAETIGDVAARTVVHISAPSISIDGTDYTVDDAPAH